MAFPAPWTPPTTPTYPAVVTPNFAPPVARTLVWPSYGGVAPRGRQPAPLPMRWAARYADDDGPSALDLSTWCAEQDDALIWSAAVAYNPGTVSAPTPALDMAAYRITISSNQIIVWLSGGQPNTDYTVHIAAATARGRLQNWQVSVLTLASILRNTISLGDLEVTTGQLLLLPDGTPLDLDPADGSGSGGIAPSAHQLAPNALTHSDGATLLLPTGLALLLS